jgi:hypothetical protein
MTTTTDAGSLFWNRFGWEYSLANGLGVPRRIAFHAARVLSRAAAPLERREGRGSAYTIVMEKPA